MPTLRTGSRELYYDVGALAIAFAVNRSVHSSAQFWTSAAAGVGFWGAITPHDAHNYQTGYPGGAVHKLNAVDTQQLESTWFSTLEAIRM